MNILQDWDDFPHPLHLKETALDLCHDARVLHNQWPHRVVLMEDPKLNTITSYRYLIWTVELRGGNYSDHQVRPLSHYGLGRY
jgi:hypothetical protein